MSDYWKWKKWREKHAPADEGQQRPSPPPPVPSAKYVLWSRVQQVDDSFLAIVSALPRAQAGGETIMRSRLCPTRDTAQTVLVGFQGEVRQEALGKGYEIVEEITDGL